MKLTTLSRMNLSGYVEHAIDVKNVQYKIKNVKNVKT